MILRVLFRSSFFKSYYGDFVGKDSGNPPSYGHKRCEDKHPRFLETSPVWFLDKWLTIASSRTEPLEFFEEFCLNRVLRAVFQTSLNDQMTMAKCRQLHYVQVFVHDSINNHLGTKIPLVSRHMQLFSRIMASTDLEAAKLGKH